MTNWQRAHDSVLDGDYTPSIPPEIIKDLKGYINDISEASYDTISELEDLADSAEALAEKAKELIGWKCEVGED